MADFNMTGEDKLLNYQRFSPSFAVFNPLENDYNTDKPQVPTYTPNDSQEDTYLAPYINSNLSSQAIQSPSTSTTKSAIDLMKEIGSDVVANKTNYVPSTSNKSLKDQLAAVESNGGNYKAFNPKGGGEGAVGKYQFRWNLWKDSIAKQTGITDKNAFMNSPDAQEQFFDYYEKTTLQPQLRQLKRQHPDTSYSDNEILRLLHFQGLGGVQKLLNGANAADKMQDFNLSPKNYLKQSS